MKVKISDSSLKKIIREGKVGYHAIGNNLYIRISKERTGFWVFRYTFNEKRKEISFGSYPEIPLAEARLRASKFKIDVQNGINLVAEKSRQNKQVFVTIDDLAQDWLSEVEKRIQNSHIQHRVYRKEIAPKIGQLPITQVYPTDIRLIISGIAASGRPSIANDCLHYLKQMFKHAVKLDLRDSNPAEAFDIADAGGAEKSRTRALSVEELREVFSVFREYSDQFTRDNYLATALLVLLGVRKTELTAAKWKEFDLVNQTWSLPALRSKTGVAINMPLSDTALELLKELQIRACGSEYVFPNRRASKRFGHISADTINHAVNKLFKEKKLTVEHFTIHDLRRTCRSLLSSIGIPSYIAERCLNHKIRGVEGIYDQHDYFAERQKALAKLADLLAPIITPQVNVVSINLRA